MKKFDGLKAIADEKKFSEIIFDLIAEYKTPELFAKFLSKLSKIF